MHFFAGGTPGSWRWLLVGRIPLVLSVFGRQQLNSETSRHCRRSFPLPKEWATVFERFRRLQLENATFKPIKLSQRKYIERESLQSLRSLIPHGAEGLEGLVNLLFLEDSTKKKHDFEAYRKQKTLIPWLSMLYYIYNK